MAFTFTDRNIKTVLHSWGRFKAVLYEEAAVGDLLALYGSAATTAMRLASSTSGYGAVAVACEHGIAGDEITCALAAELKAPATLAAGGAVTQTYFCGSTDYLGSALYLSDAGKAASSSGTTVQGVGFCSERDTILLVPGGSITGAAGSFTTLAASGATSLSTTLAVTGASTLTGAVAINGGATVASGKNVTFVSGKVIFTAGGIQESVTGAADDLVATLPGDYLIDTSSKDCNLTLPTAVAGLVIRAACSSATKQLTVTASSGDKLINASGAAKDSVKGNAAAYNNITLVAVDATYWITTGYQGTWTYS